MRTVTIRVARETHAAIRRLAQKEGVSMRDAVARAIEAYARLRADPVAWAEELEERRLFENTLMDGLEDDPPWPDCDEATVAQAPQ